VIDPNMKDAVRITVIATGFERAGMPRRVVEPPAHETRDRANPTSKPASQPAKDFQPRAFNTEDLDIPTFLRNRTR
jgi:cell division GTPase FtsZ